MKTILARCGVVALCGLMLCAVLRARAAEEQFPRSAVPDTLTATADTYIDSMAATTNYGGGTSAQIQYNPGTAHKSALVQWDLSTIPSGDAILAAHVQAICSKTMAAFDSALVIGAFRSTHPWTEGEATWNISATGTNWNTAGAKASLLRWNRVSAPAGLDSVNASTVYDRSFPAVGMFAMPTTGVTAGDTMLCDVTDAVRSWHSGRWQNDGLILDVIRGHAVSAFQFYTLDSSGNEPKLIVVHAPAYAMPRKYGADGGVTQ